MTFLAQLPHLNRKCMNLWNDEKTPTGSIFCGVAGFSIEFYEQIFLVQDAVHASIVQVVLKICADNVLSKQDMVRGI